MSARCRSCGANIVWTVTAKGKKMPVDAEPIRGAFVLVPDVTNASAPPNAISEDVHLSHFATCPNADQHRSKR